MSDKRAGAGNDEKGNLIVSSVLYESRCDWCNGKMPVRATGRKPRFCSPSHRVAMHRAVAAYRDAVEAAREAQARADALVKLAHQRVERGGDITFYATRPEDNPRLKEIRFVSTAAETKVAGELDGVPTQPAWEWDAASKSWVDARSEA